MLLFRAALLAFPLLSLVAGCSGSTTTPGSGDGGPTFNERIVAYAGEETAQATAVVGESVLVAFAQSGGICAHWVLAQADARLGDAEPYSQSLGEAPGSTQITGFRWSGVTATGDSPYVVRFEEVCGSGEPTAEFAVQITVK